MREYWLAEATYIDGFEVSRKFPYTANGNYSRECEEEYECECWLAEFANEHGEWTSYNVVYQVEED